MCTGRAVSLVYGVLMLLLLLAMAVSAAAVVFAWTVQAARENGPISWFGLAGATTFVVVVLSVAAVKHDKELIAKAIFVIVVLMGMTMLVARFLERG